MKGVAYGMVPVGNGVICCTTYRLNGGVGDESDEAFYNAVWFGTVVCKACQF